MACEIVSSGRVVLVVWGKPELRDLPKVEREVQHIRDSFGPVIFIARVPVQAEPPEQHVREAIARMLESFTELCLSYHAVIEGSGFSVATKRMALSAIFMMTGRRKRYYVHGNCDEVSSVLPLEQRTEVTRALRLFRVRGMIEGEAPRRRIADARPGV